MLGMLLLEFFFLLFASYMKENLLDRVEGVLVQDNTLLCNSCECQSWLEEVGAR